MRSRHRTSFLLALALMLALVACSSVPSTPITTGEGTMSISEINLVDSFPAGCSDTPPMCLRADEGNRLLMIWLKGQNEGQYPILDITSGAYVSGEGVERSEILAAGWAVDRGSSITFMVPETAKNFTLHWPGNDPLPLGR